MLYLTSIDWYRLTALYMKCSIVDQRRGMSVSYHKYIWFICAATIEWNLIFFGSKPSQSVVVDRMVNLSHHRNHLNTYTKFRINLYQYQLIKKDIQLSISDFWNRTIVLPTFLTCFRTTRRRFNEVKATSLANMRKPEQKRNFVNQ